MTKLAPLHGSIRVTLRATNVRSQRTALSTFVDRRFTYPTFRPRGALVKIVVDFDRCQSNALCMSAAPEIFEVRDDGYLYVLNEEPGDDQRSAVEEAVRLCPTQAISLIDR